MSGHRIEQAESHRRDNVLGARLYRLTALLSAERRTCGFADCDEPADYEAEYLDGSQSFVCPAHGSELARRAGWHINTEAAASRPRGQA